MCKNWSSNGGNGSVYFTEDLQGKQYAVKVLNSDSSKKIKRFLQEMDFQKKTNNKYIVPVFDNGYTLKHQLFYVMPLYEKNFRELMESNISKNKMLKYVLNICMALKYLKEINVFHRDLKPENIFFDMKKDRVVLGDFGICHLPHHELTEENERLANFSYHAPEQGNVNNIRHYTDVYALGLIINEIFTGSIPQGTNYKLIRDCYPEYHFLDVIVETMIINETNKRCNDINEIIEKIRYQKQENNILLKDISHFANEEVKKIKVSHKRELIKQIKEDQLRCFIYLNYPNYKKQINPNYHCNISYSLDVEMISTIKLIDIYKIVKNKFNYESNVFSKENFYNGLNLDNVTHKELYDSFYNVISKLSYYKDKHYLFVRLLKYFTSLCDYHAKEVLRDAKKIESENYENYTNAPLFWIAIHIEKYKTIIFDSNEKIRLFDYLTVNENRTCHIIEQDDFYPKTIKEILDKKLKSLFKSIQFSKNEDNYIIVFKKKKDCDKFINFCKKFKKSLNKDDVVFIDTNDLINSMNKIGYSYYFVLDGYLRYSLIQKILEFVDDQMI